MTIVIRGRTYVLSERRTRDVLNLNAIVERDTGEVDTTTRILRMAQVVVDSLLATAFLKGAVLGWPYRRFRGKKGLDLIMGSLSLQDLNRAMECIGELEGLKKKVTTGGEQESGGQSAAT